MSPLQAATTAINTIAKKYPTFVGAVVAANKHGEYGKIINFFKCVHLACLLGYHQIEQTAQETDRTMGTQVSK